MPLTMPQLADLFMFCLLVILFGELADRWFKLRRLRMACATTDGVTRRVLDDSGKWRQILAGLDFEPDSDFSVADMANVGHALMLTIASNWPDYSPLQCPSEIVSDLMNQRDDARRQSQWLTEDMLNASELSALIEVFGACASARIGSARRDDVLRKLNRRAVKAVGE